MYAEEELLPLSALQHLMFCERQCALIHIEGLWAENRLTVEGGHLHRKADEGPDESRGDVRVARGVPLRSLRLGLVGKADIVEFLRIDNGTEPGDADRGGEQSGNTRRFGDATGAWMPFPVEYKRGRPKRDRCDEVQLCAQALCLEEMLQVAVPEGALFYGKTRRRSGVVFGASLRAETEKAAARLHYLMSSHLTPRATREPKCDSCSLLHFCLPDALATGRSAKRYLDNAIDSLEPVASREAAPGPRGRR